MLVDVQELADRLLSILKDYGDIAVAYSGGVDSAVVAKGAALACGDRAVAVTAVSPSLASGELDQAKQLARDIGIRHQIIHTREFDSTGYQANAGDRCFYCKDELYSRLNELFEHLSEQTVCNGANLDDQGDHRPGMRAAREHGVRSPLIEAGMSKADVRRLAEFWGLAVWDKPASPCLSSRIAYGVTVTPERVRMVDQAEQFLRESLNIRELRVRLEQGELARIELPLEHLPAILNSEKRGAVTEHFKELGFRYVALDLEGFRSGSMNAALPMVSLETAGSLNSEST